MTKLIMSGVQSSGVVMVGVPVGVNATPPQATLVSVRAAQASVGAESHVHEEAAKVAGLHWNL